MAESIQTKLKHILEPIFWVGLISCGLYFFWSTGPHFGSTQTLYLSQDVALNEYRYRILQQFSFRANLFTGEVAILREEPKVGAGVRRVPMHVLAPSFESNASVIKDPWNSLMRIEDYYKKNTNRLVSLKCKIYSEVNWRCNDGLSLFSPIGELKFNVGNYDGNLVLNPMPQSVGESRGDAIYRLSRGNFFWQSMKYEGICVLGTVSDYEAYENAKYERAQAFEL